MVEVTFSGVRKIKLSNVQTKLKGAWLQITVTDSAGEEHEVDCFANTDGVIPVEIAPGIKEREDDGT